MRCLILLGAVTLAGCTQSGDKYPSLLPRAVESQSLAEPQRPVPVATPDAALDTRIAELAGTIDTASKAFSAAAQDAEARIAVAAGLPQGSEGWLDAQAALTGLGSLRSPILAALADLEEIAIQRGQAGEPPYPALDAAIAAADTTSRAEEARIRALEGALDGS